VSRHRNILGLLIATIVVVLGAPGAAPAQPPSLGFGPCGHSQVVRPEPELQCATLIVPFDRGDPSIGQLALAVQRVPASAPRVGTIVLLAGGPGQAAIPPFEEVIAPLSRDPSLRGFELVAFDQRGTGQSEELQCVEPALPSREISGIIGRCGEALGPTRGFYTSQASVEDLDALRHALGLPLSLLAVSYGGRVAGMYAREHPDGLARMVLDSPSPVAGPDPLEVARVHALRRVLDEGICGTGSCRSFSTDVFSDLARLTQRLRRHPIRARIYGPAGRLRPAVLTEIGVLRLLSGLDLATATRELVPAAIAAAAHGEPAALARLAAEPEPEPPAGRLSRVLPDIWGPDVSAGPSGLDGAETPVHGLGISIALFLTTFCDESQLPWAADSSTDGRTADLERWLAGTPASATAPFAVRTVARHSPLDVCLDWPPTPPAPPAPTGISNVPTLILSGEDDLRTPYEQDLALQAGYGDAQLLRIPDDGHSTFSTDPTHCAAEAAIEFLASGQQPSPCAGTGEPQALPLPPASLAQLPASGSHDPLAGRVANAAAVTLEDLFGQTHTAGGGLRGGYWREGPNRFKLHGMRDVPNVALTGTITVKGRRSLEISGRLRIRGRLAGTLRLDERTLSGRLGGAAVHVRLAAL
jgi:pimeloyl-ACP methyl ester carboxylesterase